MRFFAYLQLRQDRRSYCYTLSKVTSLESAQNLHDKIRAIDEKIADLYSPNTTNEPPAGSASITELG